MDKKEIDRNIEHIDRAMTAINNFNIPVGMAESVILEIKNPLLQVRHSLILEEANLPAEQPPKEVKHDAGDDDES